MHSRFQAVPCAVSSAVSQLERWTSLCSGQPPHITSTTLRASSGLFFHTSDALRQILSMLLMSAQGRHENLYRRKGKEIEQGKPPNLILVSDCSIFFSFPHGRVSSCHSALRVQSPPRSISNECSHERTHP